MSHQYVEVPTTILRTTLATLVHACVTSHIYIIVTHCNLIITSITFSEFRKTSLRVKDIQKSDPITLFLLNEHWIPVRHRIHFKILLTTYIYRAPPWSRGSVLNYRSLPPEFESRRGHIWRLFHLWLRFITFGGCSAHLAYHVHKSGRKTSINQSINLTTYKSINCIASEYLCELVSIRKSSREIRSSSQILLQMSISRLKCYDDCTFYIVWCTFDNINSVQGFKNGVAWELYIAEILIMSDLFFNTYGSCYIVEIFLTTYINRSLAI